MAGLVVAFALFMVLLVIGSPMFVGILLGASVGLMIQIGFNGLWAYLGDSLHAILGNYVFATIVMFVLVGALSESGGLGERAYQTFHTLLGHIRGGVFIATIGAAAAFGACSGSSIASAAMFAKVALPHMKKLKYDETLSLSCIAAAVSLSILIPPSGMMVIFGVLTQTSIGRLLIGGVVPGILLAIMLVIQVWIQVKMSPRLAPTAGRPAQIGVMLRSLVNIWPLVIVFVVIVGSIYTGVVTPSEAGALGSFVVLIWNLIIRVKAKQIYSAFLATVITSCQILILVVGGLMISKVAVYSGIANTIMDWIIANNIALWQIWGILIGVWFILGMFVDSTSQLILTLPLFFPVMTRLGVDPIVLGIAAILLIQIGVITPPVGFNVFVVSSIAGVDPAVTFRGIWPFVATQMVATVIFITVPTLSTWLPSIAFGH